MTRRLFALVLATVLVLSGCSRRSPQSAADAQPVTVLRVQNDSFYDMDIYVVRSAGDRLRLGSVTSHSTADMRIPSGILFGLSTVRFLARPLAGPAPAVSQDITIAAGDTVVMVIPH